MKPRLPFVTILLYSTITSLTSVVKGQQWIGDHTFGVGETAIYPPASFITHHTVPVRLSYPAGAALTMQTATQVQFQGTMTIYGANGPETYSELSGIVLFQAGKIMAFAPGGSMILHTPAAVLRYGRFNGNNVAIVTYPTGARVTFNCPSQPSVFPSGTNPVNFYNPGADNAGVVTQFGPSAPQVNSVTQIQVTCTGYTHTGFPIRTSRNVFTGEVYNIQQTGPTIFNVTLPSK